MWVSTWDSLLRIVAVGVPVYLGLIVFLRISGKRTLAKWNAFDFVVTVALGSTLASALLSKDVMIAEGLLGLLLLIALQFAISWLSVRIAPLRRLLKSEPSLLLHQGRFCHEIMRRERVTESEVRSALRVHGFSALEQVGAVVLETDGRFSVIGQLEGDSALRDVAGYGERMRSAGDEA